MTTSKIAEPLAPGTFRIVYAVLASGLLAVPLIAMQFTREVNWQIGDFIVFGAMLVILGVAMDLILRSATRRAAKGMAIALSVAGFVLVWAMLATG